MHYYAQIDENNICFAVTQAAEVVSSLDMTPIQGLNTELLGKKWTGEDWEDVPAPEEPEEPEETPDRIAPPPHPAGNPRPGA
jgi:hypothetical protein